MDTATDHGKTLAMFLVGGDPIRFTVSHIDGMTIEMPGEDVENEGPFIAVYPEHFSGMNGGFFGAVMQEEPCWEFEIEEEDAANSLCAALNFFATGKAATA